MSNSEGELLSGVKKMYQDKLLKDMKEHIEKGYSDAYIEAVLFGKYHSHYSIQTIAIKLEQMRIGVIVQ